MKIVLEHLTKRYPNRNRKIKEDVIAVNDFTFEIPDGKLIGLLGPSGCGKSTTLNLICGLEQPTAGRIYFGEDDVTELPAEHRGVGMVFQSYALYPHMTVRENIMFPLGNLKGDKRLSKEEMRRMAEEAASVVQIGELLDRRPGEMSGGQQQRVAIARALVKRPGVLLLDEPLSNLDARLRLQTREEIKRIQRETGVTTIFVTHDQEEAMSISDLIVVMEKGVLQQIGKPQDVYDDPENFFVAGFLGTPPINVFNGSVRAGTVFIGDDAVLEAPDVPDGEVTIGVRPEGFIPREGGALRCGLSAVEVMGRDTSVVAEHPAFTGTELRAIIRSEDRVKVGEDEVRFDISPGKLHLFDKETGERIRSAHLGVQVMYGGAGGGAAGTVGEISVDRESGGEASHVAAAEEAG